MPIKLRDFQLAGVEKIRENEKKNGHGSILAYDMGLGKTLTMSSFLIQQRLSESPIYSDLIVVPLCVLTQWEREILRVDEDMDIYIYHGPDRVNTLRKMKVKPDFVITTYHSLVTGELEVYNWNRVVLDEAHAIRNGVTSKYQDAPKRALGAFALASRSKFRHCITGTPYNNNNNDILSLMKFIGVNDISIQDFIQDFVIQKTKEDIIDPIQVETIMIPRPPRESIQDYIDYLCLYYRLMYLLRTRTNPTEVRNIYRKSVMILTKLRLYCDIMMSEKTGKGSKKTKKVNQKVKNKINKIIIDESDDEFDEEIEEIEDSENDEDEDKVENEEEVDEQDNATFAQIDKVTFYDNSVKIKSVYDKLTEMIYKVPYKRIIIFSSFVTTLDIMETIIKEKSPNIATYKYIGSKNRYERENIVKEFTKEDDSQPMVLLASLGAGSCGLNLTPCSTVFLVDISMNPFDQLQAVNRVHRITQTNQVNVYKFCMKDMIEETILMAHMRKISEAKSNGLLIL